MFTFSGVRNVFRFLGFVIWRRVDILLYVSIISLFTKSVRNGAQAITLTINTVTMLG
jgi:hypothetical protein